MASRAKLRKAKKHGFADGKRWKQRAGVLSEYDMGLAGHKKRQRRWKDKKSAEWHLKKNKAKKELSAIFETIRWRKAL